jgi:ribosomal protein S12 methylthiotransferase
MISLGCPKNLVDSEIMLGLLRKDFEITNDAKDAEILIVNTCGFIDSAKQESIDTILEMAKYKEEKAELLIVTGCMAQRYKGSIIEEIPEVDAVVGTGNYDGIAEVINRAYEGQKDILVNDLEEVDYLDNDRILTTEKGMVYLKIAEGCDNHCTYCIIPSLRGKFRSRPIEAVVKEAVGLAQNGAKELILVAQDTTRYGIDIYGEKRLVQLIKELSKIEEIQWIRLLYCYPEEIDDALIDEVANNPKVCNYFDIPIQHASDRILKLMGRRGTHGETLDVLSKIRDRVPEVVIRTSLIVGFPGETEEDFDILESFVKSFKFDRLGVFEYSREEDTPAAKMKGQIPKKVKQARRKQLMALQREITDNKNNSKVGKTYTAIVEDVSDDGIFYYGRTYAEAPDIDGLVYFTSQEPLEAGQLVEVKILNTDNYDLIGEVVYESSK